MDTKEYKAIIDRIIAVVPYVTTTLRMADDHIVDKGRGAGEKWGEVHLGKARSSINQLESLLSDARRLKEKEHGNCLRVMAKQERESNGTDNDTNQSDARGD